MNQIWGEGRQGAHPSGRSKVAQDGTRGNSSVARTEGSRWWMCGRRGTRGSCGAPQGIGLAGGGQEQSIDNGISWRMPAVGKSGRLERLAVGSSSTVLLHPQQMKVER
jgi:hypothetical protein